jgi:NTE family protein
MGERHIDGGIVSNLPAWPFDEERELDPEALTVTIEISEDEEETKAHRESWWAAALKTALFGSEELNVRLLGKTERVVLSSRLKLLDFDLAPERVKREVSDATKAVSLRLDLHLFVSQKIYHEALLAAQGIARTEIDLVLGRSAKTVRVCLGQPDKEYKSSLRMSHCVDYDEHCDEALLMPIKGSIMGRAWETGETQAEFYPFPVDLTLPGNANRLRRKHIWKEMKWQICVPILDESGTRQMVVQIDGNDSLSSSSTEVEEAVTLIEGKVTKFFGGVVSKIASLEKDNGLV